MSSTDDASSRLSNALDEIFRKTGAPSRSAGTDAAAAEPYEPTLPPRDGGRVGVPETTEPTADWSVDDEDDEDDEIDGVDEPADQAESAATERYELPEIVPATEHPPSAPSAPSARAVSLPARVTSDAPPQTATEQAGPSTSWSDHLVSAPSAQLRAPGRRPRVRRVTRVLRHIDPWSTFKVALAFSAVAYVVLLTAGVLLWRVAGDTGTLDNVERWFTQFGWETFELDGGEIFHNAWIIGLFGVVAMTGGLVLLATLFNLVSDIVGGVRLTVLEEEVVERTVSSTRRYVVRRGPAGEPAAAVAAQDWDVDGDDGDGDAVDTADPADDAQRIGDG